MSKFSENNFFGCCDATFDICNPAARDVSSPEMVLAMLRRGSQWLLEALLRQSFLVSQGVTPANSKSIFRMEYNCIAICISFCYRLSVIYMESEDMSAASCAFSATILTCVWRAKSWCGWVYLTFWCCVATGFPVVFRLMTARKLASWSSAQAPAARVPLCSLPSRHFR